MTARIDWWSTILFVPVRENGPAADHESADRAGCRLLRPVDLTEHNYYDALWPDLVLPACIIGNENRRETCHNYSDLRVMIDDPSRA